VVGVTAPVLLSIEDLTLRFGGTVAIQDFSEVVREGELLAVVGPNGAGKTSLFNSITGTVRPTSGRITFAGRDLLRMRSDRIAALGIARTFQSQELFPMAVLDNVLVGRHSRMRAGILRAALYAGWAAADERRERRRAYEILDFLRITRYAHEPVDRLPLSVQKKVEIARALALEPKLILLDEPTAGMNRKEKEDIAQIVGRIRQQLDVTVVLIEHDMRFVMDLSDRICVMDFGQRLASGLPDDVARDPAVIAAYIGGASA
jgi:branched-chain amino acid transport system ATP-binding protein